MQEDYYGTDKKATNDVQACNRQSTTGQPINEQSTDYLEQKQIHCEQALCFQPPLHSE